MIAEGKRKKRRKELEGHVAEPASEDFLMFSPTKPATFSQAESLVLARCHSRPRMRSLARASAIALNSQDQELGK